IKSLLYPKSFVVICIFLTSPVILPTYRYCYRMLPVETICGHLFCGSCIIVYSPICRQMVTLLFLLFQDHATLQQVQDGQAETIHLLQDLNDYKRLRDVPTLLHHAFRSSVSVYPVSGGALIYLASPLDFMVTQAGRLVKSHWTGVCNQSHAFLYHVRSKTL
uniref:Uncharacterized protein n=1 Tax=Hucho hucho TaxID=62062 RepID=A0A4W5KJ85_9TELE